MTHITARHMFNNTSDNFVNPFSGKSFFNFPMPRSASLSTGIRRVVGTH